VTLTVAGWGRGPSAVASATTGQTVVELVGVDPVLDAPGKPALQPGQLAAAGIRNHFDPRILDSAVKNSPVLEQERPGAPVEPTLNALDQNIPGGTLERGLPCRHAAAARALEVAMKSLLDDHPAERGPLGTVIFAIWVHFYVKNAMRLRHLRFALSIVDSRGFEPGGKRWWNTTRRARRAASSDPGQFARGCGFAG